MADLPIAAIVCIAVGCYVALIIGLVVLCYFLKGRGRCGESTCCAKDENAQSCECCISMSESCNCCQGPSLNSCLRACCPNKKKISCVDIILCQCCSSGDGPTFCDCSSRCHLCEPDPQEECNCCCLEIRLRSPRDKHTHNLPPNAAPADPDTDKTRQAWVVDPSQQFRSLTSLPNGMSEQDLRLYYGDWLPMATYPPSGHPDGLESGGDFVPTSTPRQQHQLYIKPGVYSSGRVVAKKQSTWPAQQHRLSSRRRSSRRLRSPSVAHPQQRARSPARRRSSGRGLPSNNRHGAKRSHREAKTPTSSQELDRQPLPSVSQPSLSTSVETVQ